MSNNEQGITKESFLTEGFDVTEENVHTFVSHTLYGKPYEVGDHINYVFVYTGMQGEDFIIETKTIANSELEKFNQQYVLFEGNKFVPKFMIPGYEEPDETKIIV